MDRKGQISDEETKEVVNLIDELVATQKTTNAFGEEDILTRALGGKDRSAIVNIAKDDEQVEGVTLEKMKDVGSHILWPRDLVITDNIKMDYGEFTKDMTTSAPTPIQNALVALRFLLRMVEHMRSAIQITTPYDTKDSPRADTQDDIDCIMSEWAEFVGKHVSLWAECGVCDYVFLKCLSLWAEFGVCAYVFLKCCVVDHEVSMKCVVEVCY
ncbi:uncharacterized protein E6C27_scaffold19G00020 [Cucumis melo var. makuwa]|uniref:Uncharacterized protein n=1 Tax=Cucumis melo var. makuwa TaxID=1194695 RepID=A0A5A7SLQ0_CUCMM|nr:uncharacterized protein E6C27_scaffold19G00020 [Cucumis melo var. makuwa]